MTKEQINAIHITLTEVGKDLADLRVQQSRLRHDVIVLANAVKESQREGLYAGLQKELDGLARRKE